jgi:hypothetical protein
VNTKDQLDHATRLRSAAEGDPTQGHYPATVFDLAAEVVAWINKVDAAYAPGLRTAVITALVRDSMS